MNLLTLALIGVGLSVDSLAASITTGACSKRIKANHVLKVAVFMALFQGTMPLIGWIIGNSFKNVIANFDHWVAFVLLLGIGGKLIYEGIKSAEENNSGIVPTKTLILMGMALATSIDALIIGISFGLIEVNIWLAMIVIGTSTFIFSTVGVLVGKKIGKKINKGIEISGGAVLVLLGLKILFEHIYF
ncbi:MAG: manganese efflux pump [Bacteroidales bacterium]|nr:manganese efflux pump [Bacteroidales bacterium]